MRPAARSLKLLPPRTPERPPAPVAPPSEPPVPQWLTARPRRRFPRLRFGVPQPHLPLPRPAHWTRYTWGLVALLVLGLLARLPGLAALPFDTPSGPQAATAAFVRRLVATGGDIKAAIPWLGPMPTAPTAGLPLYAWLAALFTGLAVGAPWVGRAISVLAALVATAFLFVVVRRLAGGRAALYAALFLTVAPAGLYYGRAYLPDALGWAAACGALAAALRWRDSVLAERPHIRRWFAVAAGAGALAVLVAPANLALLLPLVYLAWPSRWLALSNQQASDASLRANGNGHLPDASAWPAPLRGASLALDLRSERNQARDARLLVGGFAALVVAPLLLWWLLMRMTGATATLDSAYGGGVGAVWDTLRHGEFWSLLGSNLINGVLTFAGILLILAGLGRPARQPWPWVFHLWVLGGLLVVLASAPRLAADDATLAPLLPALAALIGLGANWLATLPALAAAAMRGQEEAPGDLDADLADGLPADEPDPEQLRENGRPAHGAVRRGSRVPGIPDARPRPWPALRATLLRVGNAIAILLMLAVLAGGANALARRYEVNPVNTGYANAGAGARTTDPAKAGGRLIVAGPGAPEMFYTSGLTGWAVPEDNFSREVVDQLKAQGAAMLMSADRDWMLHQHDYPGLLASFRVALLSETDHFIVFDLRQPPASSDYRYFLESGHTLRGAFRTYWESHGGVAQFGYPLTDEITEVSPVDGKQRTVQYFERAEFELHPDTPAYMVQLASVGSLILRTHEKQAEAVGSRLPGLDPVPASPETPTYHFFKETGHSVKGEFLKFWQSHGGVALLGYPVSEEVNEISPADGKVHIVQYFERARLEWHQEAAGTPQQVQLGLLGQEWLNTPRP